MNAILIHSAVIYRKALIVFSQSCLIVLAYFCAFGLHFNFHITEPDWRLFTQTLPLVIGIKLALSYPFGLLRGWWRYTGLSDLLDLTRVALISSFCLYCISLYLLPAKYPFPTIIVLDFAFTILIMGGARFAVRAYTEAAASINTGKRTLIVGANELGATVVRELMHNLELNYKPVGFVDDDSRKNGIKISGIKVLGSTQDLPQLIDRYEVACVLIANSSEGKQVQKVMDACRESTVDLRILPPIDERINGKHETSPISKMRSVRVEDLLGREPVMLETDAIRNKISGKVLLISGAGGSIGSELARQIASFGPKKLVLFERSENDVFAIWNQLILRFPHIEHVPVVGDILDVTLLREVFALHRPHSVFHAAAYKHVPLMEKSCFQAVSNNIFGTYNLAMIAKQYQAEDFILISSDKAVNPSNIMGVTKRVAELIVLGLSQQHTKFIAVRFGNVMGSNGSVLPIFERQIGEGGPITVTHPDATRYFMTIPEAAQLVLQAATMGHGGEIFVLDMGEPVRILDLARNLIRLSGLEVERDIKIVFTGLRPGEKLFEQIVLEGENIKRTHHDKIRVLQGNTIGFEQVSTALRDLSALLDAKNVHSLITKLGQIVPEYTPSKEVLALCELDRHDMALHYRSKQAELIVGVAGAA